MEKRPAVYIRTNSQNAVLYVGVTSDVFLRDWYHRQAKASFVARYRLHKLVWYCEYETMADAIYQEKRLKAGSRQHKIDLVNAMNPEWLDLSVNWRKP